MRPARGVVKANRPTHARFSPVFCSIAESVHEKVHMASEDIARRGPRVASVAKSTKIQERLEREFDMNLITTCPNVSYMVKTKEGKNIQINNPTDMPESGDIEVLLEPYIKADIIVPT